MELCVKSPTMWSPSATPSEVYAKRWSPNIKFYEKLRSILVIYVEIPRGEFVKVECSPTTTILEVKKFVEKQTDVPVINQCLSFMGRCLENERSLMFCEITSCSVLELKTKRRIHIQIDNHGLYHCDVMPHESVEDLKMRVKRLFGIPLHRQCLYFKDELMRNEESMCAFNIRDNDQLEMNVLIQVFVLNGYGKTRVLTIKSSQTVDNLKKQIEFKEGIPCKWIKLSHAGKMLDDHRSLTDYNIQNESMIIMSVRHFCSRTPEPEPPENKEQLDQSIDENACYSNFDPLKDIHNSTMIDSSY